MVTTFYPPYHFGGDAVFVRSLSRALVARGHHVEVIHCEDAYRLRVATRETTALAGGGTEENDGVVVHRLRLGKLSPLITQQTGQPGMKRKVLARLLGQPFDVVNFHNISLVGGVGVLPLSQARLNLYTLHEHWLLCATHSFWKNREEPCDKPQCLQCCARSGIPPQLWRYTGTMKKALRHVDVLLAPSAYTAERHRQADLGRPVRHLPTFSSLDPGDLLPWQQPERPRFVCVSRVTASKGVDRLVEVFSRLPEYDLDVVGSGDLLGTLRKRYTGHPQIRFRSEARQHDMGHYYAQAHALLLPSQAPEVFPLCTLEAFAHGTPAIVSDAGGSPEAIDYSGAGFVYRNEAELAAAVRTLAEAPQVRVAMGRLARAAFEQYYNERRYVEEYLSLILKTAVDSGFVV